MEQLGLGMVSRALILIFEATMVLVLRPSGDGSKTKTKTDLDSSQVCSIMFINAHFWILIAFFVVDLTFSFS